jgi:hypothetical protein
MVLEDENPQFRSVGCILYGTLSTGKFLNFQFQFSCLSNVLEVPQFSYGTILELDWNTSYLKDSLCLWQAIFLDKADIASFKLIHHRPGTGGVSFKKSLVTHLSLMIAHEILESLIHENNSMVF